MAVTYLRLFPATQQFELRNGQLNVAGRLNVFFESTDDLADLYDENGTQLAQPVILDDNGRARGLFVDSKKVYRLEVYDQFGELLYTVRKMVPSGGGTGSALGKVYDVVSNDGSILVDKFDEGGTTTFDLSLGIDANELKPSCLRASAAPVTTDGQFVFDELVREGNLLSVDQSGKVRMEPAWYHFTAIVELSYDGTPVNEAHQVTLWTTLSNSVIDLDTSYAHRESIELSGDIHVVGNNTEFPLGVSGLDTGITASLMSFDIHAVTGHEGNNEYHAGEGITIVNATKTISADFESVQEKLVAGENISITGNVISAGSLTQEQSDWTEDDTTSPAYIKHKPDLDVYATQAQLTYGLAGKQDVISDLAAIRSGAQAGSSAVQPADLANVATTGSYDDLNNRPNLTVYATKTEVNTGLATKQDVISDLSTIRSGAAAGATAVQPTDLNAYATDADLTAGLATKQDVLTPGENITISNNVISATDQRQADWAQSDSSAVDYIRNKPDLSTYATDAELTAGLATKQDTINDLSTIRSGAAAGSTALQPADVAEVAVSGDYADLINKPTIPTKTSDLTNDSGFITASGAPVQDVQVDGTSVVNAQGIAEITMPTTGVLDVEVDGTSVVNAQGTAEIDLSGYATTQALTTGLAAKQDTISDLATIRSGAAEGATAVQPGDLATVATTGSYDDLADKPSIPAAQVNSDWNASSGVAEILNKPQLSTVATTGDYDDLSNKPSIPAAQVNSDWNAVSGVSEILNKPNLATVATTGAYSDLTGAPTINNVPAVTSSDNDKVLKASYSGGVGSYSWQTEQGGGSTYTAGDGVEIDNDEISVLYDSDTLKLKPQDQTFTYALGTWDENYGRAYAQTTADIRGILEEEAGLELTLHIPANTFYLNGTYGENIVLRISNDQYFNYSNYCLTPLSVTYDSVENKTWIDEQDIVLHTPDQDPDYWHISSDHSARYVAFGLTSGSNLCTITSAAAGNNVTVTFTHAGGNPQLAVKNPLPASAIGDAAKVLTVDNTGAPVWATAQAPISAGTGISITNNVVSVDNTVAMKSDLPAAYTGGDGISIANNEISAKAGTGLEIADVSETTTDNLVCAAMSSRYELGNWAQDICPMTQALADAMNTSAGYAFTLVKPFDTYNVYAWPAIAKTSELLQGELQNYAFFGNYLSCRPSTDGSDRPYEVPAGTTLTLKFSERDQFSTITVADILADLSSYSLVILWYDEDSPYAAETMLSTTMTPETTATHTTTTTLQDALCVSNPLPASTVADADKVLKVNSSGAPEWTTGGGSQVNSDWDATSGVAEILNKPVPKTLTAGTGISITENQSTITIANTVTPPTVDQTYSAASTNAQSGTAVADAIGNLGTNLSASQLLALKEALGVDETVLYEDSTGSGTVQLSEDPNHFERLGITYHLWNDNAGEQYVEVPANQTLYTFGGDYVPSAGSVAHFYTRLSYSTPTLTCDRHCFVNTSAATTVSDGTATFKFYKVVGIHRVASN